MATIYNLNKDLNYIKYLKNTLEDLQVQFNDSFENMVGNDFNTWMSFKENLLIFCQNWRQADIKRTPYIEQKPGLSIANLDYSKPINLSLKYFDVEVELIENEIKFKAPRCYLSGLKLYLRELNNAYDQETITLGTSEISKVYILFLLGIVAMDEYTNSINFEWLFHDFRCVVPTSHLHSEALFHLEELIS
eukprot:NODE_20_length_44879_cov_0.624654.p31 type:complete len:191 gc:universal NODE_20_length_44879_cov_0.624654:7543-8115(+)